MIFPMLKTRELHATSRHSIGRECGSNRILRHFRTHVDGGNGAPTGLQDGVSRFVRETLTKLSAPSPDCGVIGIM